MVLGGVWTSGGRDVEGGVLRIRRGIEELSHALENDRGSFFVWRRVRTRGGLGGGEKGGGWGWGVA